MNANCSRRGVLAGAAAFAVAPTLAPLAAPAIHLVEIWQLKFVPETIKVRPGEIIRWVNMDIAPHTVTALDRSWDSKRMKKRKHFELTVTETTELDYFCIFHPHMKGTIAFIE